MDGSIRTEAELVSKYREMSQYPEIDMAIDDIVNEVITEEPETKVVELILDDLDQPDRIKQLLIKEFDGVLDLLEFNELSYDVFRRWYIDGRLYYHAIVDEQNVKNGITELRYIDPRKIRKIREISRKKSVSSVPASQTASEYYMYNEKGFAKSAGTSAVTTDNINGIKIAKDSIVHCTSGLMSSTGDMVQSFVHKAIKPLNMLRSMEDSLVIYRISRAPERRIFYVDVGNLPKMKAEQYVKDLMTKFKNKLVYDSATGEIRDDRKFMTMLEDFWLPRREGGKGTEITTLPGGCLAMNTRVSLLDGRELTLSEIEDEMAAGKSLWTYSCDPKTGQVVPGLISWAGVTQQSAMVMKLTLDNGKSIICTPDHKFPVYGKGFVQGRDLVEGESMIPLYRRKQNINGKNDYEQVFDNNLKSWVYTHRVVADYLKDDMCKYYVYNKSYSSGSYDVRHHIDFNRYNNTPSNLAWMSWHDHRKLHNDFGFTVAEQALGTITARDKMKWIKENDVARWDNIQKQRRVSLSKTISNRTPEKNTIVKTNISNGIKSYIEGLSKRQRELRDHTSTNNILGANKNQLEKLQNNQYKKQHYKRVSESWTNEMRAEAGRRRSRLNYQMWCEPNKKQRHAERQKLVFDYSILQEIIKLCKGKTTHEFTREDVVAHLNNNNKILAKFLADNNKKQVPNWNPAIGFTRNMLKNIIGQHGYTDGWHNFRKNLCYNNHCISKIEYLPDPIPVGTLTIDHNELFHAYHTFALSVGIFTKNSNLGQIDDIIYFQRKLYKALNVPISRMDPEYQFTLGRATEITRDEVKFAKFVTRLRKKFSLLFTKILERQLILKGIITPEEWDDFSRKIGYKFSQDNYFAELKETEILTGRMALLRDINDYAGIYYSHDWIRRNILRQSDEDIKENDQQIKAEVNIPQFMPPEVEQPGGSGPPAASSAPQQQ